MSVRASSPIALVAGREIREAFRSKGTKILLVLSALAVAGIVVIAHFASQSGDSASSTTDVAVVGDVSLFGASPGQSITIADIEFVTTAYPDADAARAALDDEDVDVVVLAPGGADGAELVTRETVDLDSASSLATSINLIRSDLATTAGLLSAGLDQADIDALTTSPLPPVSALDPGDSASGNGSVGTAVVMNVLLFLLLQMYGNWILQGVTREKESRVIEVLMSAVTARQLLFGKTIGVGSVALINAGVLIASALITSQIVGLDVFDGFRAGDVAIGGVWFLLGYALYCSAYAAAGALCSRTEDAQSAAMPIMLPLLAGYIIGFTSFGGASPILWVFAFFPPTAVLCMPVLYALGEVSAWGMVLSMVLTAAAALLVAMLAARIYERAILRSGKRISWRQALRRDGAGTDSPNPPGPSGLPDSPVIG